MDSFPWGSQRSQALSPGLHSAHTQKDEHWGHKSESRAFPVTLTQRKAYLLIEFELLYSKLKYPNDIHHGDRAVLILQKLHI